MNKIVVSDKNVGKCTIEYRDNDTDAIIKEKKELVIKSLAALQLLCMTKTKETESDFDHIISVLKNAVDELDELHNPTEDENGFFTDYYN